MDHIYKELAEKNLISEEQFTILEAIRTNKIVSLYYELRLVLYLGIMLFTGGVGYLAYKNMSEVGHLLCMALIAASIVAGFYFIQKFAKPYSNSLVTVDQVYFDYILILVSLLIISLFAYIQVYFELVELLLNWTSFISTGILFLMAYRYDNKALLSMGITALAAAVGISITPVDWTQGEWMMTTNLYLTSILLGMFLLGVAEATYRIGIKKHFSFAYQNFGLILFYIGGITAMFERDNDLFFAISILLSSLFLIYYTWVKKEFLFFLYSSIAGDIALTYLLFQSIKSSGNYEIFIYYFPFTCIAYIVFLVRKKSHFAHE
jgi:hypothetical protein